MKKLTIGRNNACDVVIPDTSDLVSRRQAVLRYYFSGKMVLYDTSNNGTYVNGKKLENGKGFQVTRKDKVNFARIADLDWKEVKDPYRKSKIVAGVCTIIIVVVAIIFTWWSPLANEEASVPVQTEMSSDKGMTETTVRPQVVNERPKQQPAKRSTKKGNGKKGKSGTPNNVNNNKDVDDNSPIVY